MTTEQKRELVKAFREKFGYINHVGVERERFESQEAWIIEQVEAAEKRVWKTVDAYDASIRTLIEELPPKQEQEKQDE